MIKIKKYHTLPKSFLKYVEKKSTQLANKYIIVHFSGLVLNKQDVWATNRLS